MRGKERVRGICSSHVRWSDVDFVKDHETPLPSADFVNDDLAARRSSPTVTDHAVGGDDHAGLAFGRKLLLCTAREHVHLLLLLFDRHYVDREGDMDD